jgi:hypothetical protein
MRSVDEEALRTTTHRDRTTRLARTQNVSQPGSPSGNQGGTQDDRAWSDWDWFDVDLDVLGGPRPHNVRDGRVVPAGAPLRAVALAGNSRLRSHSSSHSYAGRGISEHRRYKSGRRDSNP